MTDQIASLGMKVDSQQVAAGAVALDQLADSAVRAEGATMGAESATEALANATRNLKSASTSAVSAQSQQIASLQAISRFANQGAQSSVGSVAQRANREATASLEAYWAATRKIPAAQDKVTKAQGAAALSAKQYGQAMRLLPAQITDIVTGLVSGQPAYLVAIQQGGQLRDSFGGIGATLKALGSLLTPTRLLLGGVAAIAATVAIAFNQAQKEGAEFNKAIALTGGAAGVTSDQLQTMAKNVDKVVGTQRQASAVLAELAKTGQVSSELLQSSAIAAIQLQKNAGISTEETVKNLAALGDRPVEASRKLNEQYHYLKASIYEQIVALEEQGRHAEAATLAESQYLKGTQKIAEEAGKQLTILQSIAKDTKSVFAELWDGIVSNFRPDTLQDQIDRIEGQLQRAENGLGRFSLSDKSKQQLQSKLNSLKEAQRLTSLFAEQDKKSAKEEEQRIKDTDIRSAAARTAREQAERDADQRSKARLQSRVTAIQTALRAEVDAYEQQGDLLDAQHSANLVSDADYYAAKRQLIEASAAAQAKALESQNRVLREGTAAASAAAQAARAKADSLFGKGSADYTNALAEATRKASEAQQVQIQNDAQITANIAEETRLTKDQASQVAVLVVQEKARADALVLSYQQAAAAAQNYLDTLARQYRLEEQNQFAGNRQRERDSGRSAIEDKFAQQRQQIEIDQSNNPTVDPKIYEQRRALVAQSLQEELALYDAHWTNLREGETNWRNGATEAINNYVDDARDIASRTGNLVSNALREGEDAWVRFVQTGKLSVKSLVNSVIADFARLQFKSLLGGILGNTSSGFGGFLSGIFGGARAGGGDVESGKAYVVGEKRPELFVPRTAGRIIPNLAMASVGGGSVTNHITIPLTIQAPNGRISRTTEAQASVMLVRAVQRGTRSMR